ncbi:MAG: integrase arm-type DNA-binding domain-containing protein [Pseudomonadota bacterium]
MRRLTLGSYPSMRLPDARSEADRLRGAVSSGCDPIAERKQAASDAEQRSQVLGLSKAIRDYDLFLERRDVRDRKNVISALRRRLLGDSDEMGDVLGDVLLTDIQRHDVMRIVNGLELSGMSGAARSLRQKTTTFLNWAVDEGRLSANPLAGMRKRRETRTDRLKRPGRMLSDVDLARLFHSCSSLRSEGSLGQRLMSSLVQILILTGQRRTETSRMRYEDLSDDWSWWTIPASVAKNGLAHDVPLPLVARKIVHAVPRHHGCPWVFSTNGAAPISGWSKLEPKIRVAASAFGLEGHWTLHDLPRSFRSGLTRLRIDSELAEIMLNHRPERLRSIYDLEPRLDERAAAAAAWADHVQQQVSTGLELAERPDVVAPSVSKQTDESHAKSEQEI